MSFGSIRGLLRARALMPLVTSSKVVFHPAQPPYQSIKVRYLCKIADDNITIKEMKENAYLLEAEILEINTKAEELVKEVSIFKAEVEEFEKSIKLSTLSHVIFQIDHFEEQIDKSVHLPDEDKMLEVIKKSSEWVEVENPSHRYIKFFYYLLIDNPRSKAIVKDLTEEGLSIPEFCRIVDKFFEIFLEEKEFQSDMSFRDCILKMYSDTDQKEMSQEDIVKLADELQEHYTLCKNDSKN